MKLFRKYFPYKRRDRMVEVLYASTSNANNYNVLSSIDSSFKYFVDKIKDMPKGARTEEQAKISNIVNKILNFNEQNQQGSGLKVLTTIQMLKKLPIFLAQLSVGNNSEKL